MGINGYILGVGANDFLEEVVVKPILRFNIAGIDIVISNHTLMITVAAVLLMVLLPAAVGRPQPVRRGFGNFIESICVFLRDEVAAPAIGRFADDYIFFIWTIFFFILTLNLLGMVPSSRIFYLMTGRENRFGGAATANIWITGALAGIAFVMIHVSGIRRRGFWGYIRNFAPRVPWPIMPLIFLMELFGSLVKPVALAVRLFANILAGHILVAVVLGMAIIFKSYLAASVSVVAAVMLSVMDVMMAFLQAYIFTFLSAMFIGFAVCSDH